MTTNINLLNLNINQGFTITGVNGVTTGVILAKAGDMNKDGFDDIIISSNSNIIYVLFGKQNFNISSINLANIGATEGFKISNNYAGEFQAISSAGDINKDGDADIIMGINAANSLGRATSGASYVLYGNSTMNLIDISLDNLSSAFRGFTISGANSGDRSGRSVSGLGNVDKDIDQYDDMIIGGARSKFKCWS